uniref:UDP-N-acetylglucosamine diphosphorylase n=1 Tax=Aegilops tauschii TaxID=37682 RepID=R7WA54_AEGTA
MKEMMVGSVAPVGPVGRWGAAPPQELLERMKDYGQEGAFALWDELSPEDRDLLVRDIESLDLSRIDRIIRRSMGSQAFLANVVILLSTGGYLAPAEPVPESSVSRVEERSPEDKERWWKKGLRAISEGRLAVVLLAGGQGTRLGSSDPKGCFSPRNTLPIHWYIMTSPFTDDVTRKFFESRKYFGLEADQVTFFQQGTLPCVSDDGRFIMETPYKVAKAPDGNGGVYAALKSKKLLDDMSSRGVKYVDCYGVDNVLVRVADPTFLGYFIEKGVSSAAKVVRKAYPQENVGVFVQRGRGGPLSVVEYSEMDAAMTTEINQSTGRLRYCWSNVCLHMFSLEFLNQVANSLEKDTPDIWKFGGQVLREEEFAPVKNANGSAYDTPDSAKLMLLRLHSRWVVAAGGFLTHSVPLYMTGVEVSPLSSYAGENLEAICRGRTFHAPSEISF